MTRSKDTRAGTAARRNEADAGYAWLHDGNMPRTREDVIAEVVALIALLFSLGIGLLIAMLPVSATAAAPSRELAAFAPDGGTGTVQFRVTVQQARAAAKPRAPAPSRE